FGVDLEVVARGCGFARTASVSGLGELRSAVAQAMADNRSWVIVGRVEKGDSPHRPSKNCIALRDRFMQAVAAE
ncbi:MAG: thiamine pyrophosphate-binding protein, partial [Chloroflexi bacterium]|nr:thiamine pyrophosphate-binding protein [Chloroflexota bacterium]